VLFHDCFSLLTQLSFLWIMIIFKICLFSEFITNSALHSLPKSTYYFDSFKTKQMFISFFSSKKSLQNPYNRLDFSYACSLDSLSHSPGVPSHLSWIKALIPLWLKLYLPLWSNFNNFLRKGAYRRKFLRAYAQFWLLIFSMWSAFSLKVFLIRLSLSLVFW
jgi:hypothetical protein